MAQLAARPPRRVAALAALAAAALTTLSTFSLLLLAAGDFDLTFGDRLRIATGPVAAAVPLLLAVALLLHDHVVEPPGSTDDDGFGLGALVVGGVATLLLLARLVAHLFAGEAAASSGGFDGVAGRLSTFLVDLAALVLAVALTSWALRVRDRGAGAAADSAPPVAGPSQQRPPVAPSERRWDPDPPSAPGQGPPPPG